VLFGSGPCRGGLRSRRTQKGSGPGAGFQPTTACRRIHHIPYLSWPLLDRERRSVQVNDNGWLRICRRNIERSPFSAWFHLAFAAANGACPEAGRERLTGQGHCRGAIFFAEQWRTIVNNGELENSDLATGLTAVSSGATLAHSRRKKAVFRVSCLVFRENQKSSDS